MGSRCNSQDESLATRAGRVVLLRQQADGLVRITLKRPYSDETVAVDMDPLSTAPRRS